MLLFQKSTNIQENSVPASSIAKTICQVSCCTSHVDWNQIQKELFQFHCFPGNCSDRSENPADRHALKNRLACDRGHQLCLLKVGTAGNNSFFVRTESVLSDLLGSLFCPHIYWGKSDSLASFLDPHILLERIFKDILHIAVLSFPVVNCTVYFLKKCKQEHVSCFV